ncbi:MAG TPA: hypothetical protein VNN10_09655 [Dehalococcoidia bacterium]|nr:hypothetical protein [Dehalococcoidia bacterium]
MTRRQRIENRLERAVLGGMIEALAFVLEKALDRMASGERHRRSEWGQRLFRRLMSSAHEASSLSHHFARHHHEQP